MPVPDDRPSTDHRHREDRIVVGILYAPEWYGDDEAFARALAELEQLDPRIEVVVEAYVEPHELRTARGKAGADTPPAAVPPLSDAQRAALARINIAVTLDLPFDVGAVAPNLRWVQAVGAGTAQLQSAGLADAGIRLTSASGVNAVAIAEFAITRVLQHWKRLRALDEHQARHEWDSPAVYGRELAGATLGLIGLGEINRAVASRARAFRMRLLATRRSATTPGATAPEVDELFPPTELHDMLGRCDAVVSAVPETPETAGLMDAAAFAAMKPGGFFCNVGRGSLVDEAALIDALTRGHLGAAALDVTRVEPLPPDDPLWDAPNLYLSPHSAASPVALFVNLHELFLDNLRRYLAGEPLRNEVDLDRGY